MKVIHYVKYPTGGTALAAGALHCYYVPDLGVVLTEENQLGTRPGAQRVRRSLRADGPLLEEAERIAKGETPSGNGMSFSGIQEVDYDETRLDKLINDVRSMMGVRRRVTTEMIHLRNSAK
tara:strand:+ start:137 stop:499 length:363 start_codon:yes stop_codon:yes gene_type:complete